MNSLSKDMKQLKETNDSHTIQLTRIEQELKYGNKEFADLNRYIEGNGQPGMIDRLSRVEGKFIMIWSVLVLIIIAIITSAVTKMI